MSPLEIAAAAASLACVILTIRRSILCWPIGIAGVALYLVVFWRARLYADMGLQAVYVVLQGYGWWEWLHGGPERTELPVSRAGRRTLAALAAAVALGTVAIATALARWTDAALPWVDSLQTALSLAAQWMLARKYVESWPTWVAVDVLSVGMYASRGLWVTTGLYAVFLVLATLGWIEWKKALVAPRPGSSSGSSSRPIAATGSSSTSPART